MLMEMNSLLHDRTWTRRTENSQHISWCQKCRVHVRSLLVLPYQWGTHHLLMKLELGTTSAMAGQVSGFKNGPYFGSHMSKNPGAETVSIFVWVSSITAMSHQIPPNHGDGVHSDDLWAYQSLLLPWHCRD